MLVFQTLFFSAVIIWSLCWATYLCPNGCSGHGVCTSGAVGKCKCFPGFSGGDCSQRVCAAGKAWVDFPSDDNVAHAEFTECSNMGTCDRATGICKCSSGFSGAACDIMLCPMARTATAVQMFASDTAMCSGNGRCMSLREVNWHQDYMSYSGSSDYSGWDADLVHGCVCDKGWEGPACEKRSCPRGDDPLTPDGSDDVQVLDCDCSTCQGGVHLTFQGQQTALIPFDAPAKFIEHRLQQLSSLSWVEVKFRRGTRMCSEEGSITQIRFRAPTILKSPFILHAAGGLRGSVITMRWGGARSLIDHDVASLLGTREYAECSNRGVCDYLHGTCKCFGGYTNSDGLTGGPGTVGDCGHRRDLSYNYTYVNSTTSVQSSCPFVYNGICSGNGICNEQTGMCACFDGYGGPACANMTCPTSFTWFGKIDAEHTGTSICGGVGNCDGHTGRCIDCGGHGALYYGDQCQYLSCPGNGTVTCGQNGVCLTMRELAALAYNDQKELSGVLYDTPWDADHIRGCACARSISVDNQYDPLYRAVVSEYHFNRSTNASSWFDTDDLERFYRGPFAFAATDYRGYDCQSALCPKGDSMRSRGVNEIQELHCLANNGTFRLTFRENTTVPISYNATTAELRAHLEQLYTISKVDVTTKDRGLNHSVCNVFDNITVYIEFLTETGDLPLLVPDVSGIRSVGFGLEDYGGAFVMNITEFQRGTKSDVECSSQGICDETRGRCACFEGFGSSNGTLTAAGERGDCSFVNPLYTEKFLAATKKPGGV